MVVVDLAQMFVLQPNNHGPIKNNATYESSVEPVQVAIDYVSPGYASVGAKGEQSVTGY